MSREYLSVIREGWNLHRKVSLHDNFQAYIW